MGVHVYMSHLPIAVSMRDYIDRTEGLKARARMQAFQQYIYIKTLQNAMHRQIDTQSGSCMNELQPRAQAEHMKGVQRTKRRASSISVCRKVSGAGGGAGPSTSSASP